MLEGILLRWVGLLLAWRVMVVLWRVVLVLWRVVIGVLFVGWIVVELVLFEFVIGHIYV